MGAQVALRHRPPALASRISLWAILVLVGWTMCSSAMASSSALVFSGDVEARYDDNVLYSTDPTDDFIMVVAPRLLGKYGTERLDLGFSAAATCYGYQDNDDLDTVDQRYAGFWRNRWTERFQSSLDAGYVDDQSRDRVLEETGLLTNETHRRRVDGTLGAQYTLSALNSLSASYTFLNEAYDDPRTDDLIGHELQAGLFHRLSVSPERTTGFLQMRYNTYEYTNSYSFVWIPGLEPVSVDSERDINTWALSLGVEHDWTEKLKLNASAGGRYTRYRNEIRQGNSFRQQESTEADDPWGFVGALSLDYTGLYTNAGLALSHDLAPASGRNGLTERTSARVSSSWRVSQEWLLGTSFAAFLNRSERTGATVDIDERSLVFTGTVRYEMNRYWSMGLRYSYYRLDARQNDTERDRNIVGLVLGWNLPLGE